MHIGKVQKENITVSLSINENNTTINKKLNSEKETKSTRGNKNRSSNTIYAGDLNINQDSITSKKLQAKRNSMKAILDQHANEKSIDDGISARFEHQKELMKDMDLAAKQISNLKKMQEELKSTYGITEDSEEHKNLKLLEQSMMGTEELSEDQMTQLKEMGPLTEYQKSALQYDSMQQIWQQRVDDAQAGITNEAKTITAINLDRLKKHPMVDAQM